MFVRKYPFWKMLMDYSITISAVIVLIPILILLVVITSYDTGFPGIFVQQRIGRNAYLFNIYKFRTIHPKTFRKSKIGSWIRKSKLDELPQLFNILKGDMSLIGPRPDIPGYYDKLKGNDRLILQLKPGLISEAGIKYSNEEELLNQQENPVNYNDNVLFPDKVKMNLEYYYNLSIRKDLSILLKVFSIFRMK
ncbi:Putative undecaprenyl-phosphate N-acetylgalactosaminyl 1-phosphate transferase [Chryseobacterium potabilaquae]|uniref:Undecaprenyl-phosphate N-acetylgalactosaminyl 1-phosphate transferase n=2 Tax=Chryseobacterium potabilaquae TaxID=2675057 RepID=A0A6N4X6D9_9FLAO|nr:Putative undecaprenyl-phosphate N-acetylgalactosaminyl 1-phosphate transferase [Chryseobacterium potabilaquae]